MNQEWPDSGENESRIMTQNENWQEVAKGDVPWKSF
jgi:hypothetical protein